MAELIALYSAGPHSGKSEVASLLVARHDFVVVKLAHTMKRMVRVLLLDLGIHPLDLDRYIEGDLKETPIPGLGVTARYLFQTLGTEWGRDLIHKKIWTGIAQHRYQPLLDAGISVVVDDMRFPNEFEALKEAGGVMVKVTRPGVEIPTGHGSEGLLEDIAFDFEVANDGSKEDLALSVATLVEIVRL